MLLKTGVNTKSHSFVLTGRWKIFTILLISLDLSVVKLNAYPQLNREPSNSPGFFFQSPPNWDRTELLEVETTDVQSTIIPSPTFSLPPQEQQQQPSEDDDYIQATTIELESPVAPEIGHEDNHTQQEQESTPGAEDEINTEPTQPVPEKNSSLEQQEPVVVVVEEEEQKHQGGAGEHKNEDTAETSIKNPEGPSQEHTENHPHDDSASHPEQPEMPVKKEEEPQTESHDHKEPEREREREEELFTNHNVHASVEVKRKDEDSATTSDPADHPAEETQQTDLEVPAPGVTEKQFLLESNPTTNNNNGTDENGEIEHLQQPESSSSSSSDIPPVASESGEQQQQQQKRQGIVATISIREININNNNTDSQENNNKFEDTQVNNNKSSSTSNTDAELVPVESKQQYLKHGVTYYIQSVQDNVCLTTHKHKFLENNKGLILGKVTAEDFVREDGQIFDAIAMGENEESSTRNSDEFWLSSLKYNVNEVTIHLIIYKNKHIF